LTRSVSECNLKVKYGDDAMLYYLLIGYIAIGVLMNFVGPLKSKIWQAKMNAISSKNTSSIKLFLFEALIRIGVVIFYPIFLIKR
jgi:uncharacterized membrane protein YqhA